MEKILLLYSLGRI